MSNRLPTPGGDSNDWGSILNDYLEVSLNADGTLQTAAIAQAGGVTSVNSINPVSGAVTLTAADVGAYSLPGGGIPATDLDSSVQTSLGAADSAVQLGGDLGGTTASPTVISTHLSSPLPVTQGGTGTNNAVTVVSNAGTCSASYYLNTFTNSSAGAMSITLSTSGAVDGQRMVVRIYDFSAATQSIGWFNAEASTVTTPTVSNGSTTSPLTVGFMYNAQTSKWRCLASG